MWGDFLLHRLKRELCCLTKHIAIIGLSSFLCAIGGVVLWINGGSGWYVLNSVSANQHGRSLTFIFLVWLIVYALYGARLVLIAFSDTVSCSCQKRVVLAFSLTSFSYLLDLVWYALFFCTRLTIFSLIVLSLSAILNVVVILISKHGLIIAYLLNIVVIIAQFAFVCFTSTFILLN